MIVMNFQNNYNLKMVIGSNLGQVEDEAAGGQFSFSVAISSYGSWVTGGASFHIFNGLFSDVGKIIVYKLNIETDQE